MTEKTKATTHHEERGYLPLFNSNVDAKIHASVFSFLELISMTISFGTTIYGAWKNGDFSMVTFVTFVYFIIFMSHYRLVLCHKLPPLVKSPKKLHLIKIGMWVLESAIMLGFAYAFSTFMGLAASLSFFGMVIVCNTVLFYVYFVWDGDKNSGVGSPNEGKKRKTRDYGRNRKPTLKKYRHLALALENV